MKKWPQLVRISIAATVNHSRKGSFWLEFPENWHFDINQIQWTNIRHLIHNFVMEWIKEEKQVLRYERPSSNERLKCRIWINIGEEKEVEEYPSCIYPYHWEKKLQSIWLILAEDFQKQWNIYFSNNFNHIRSDKTFDM